MKKYRLFYNKFVLFFRTPEKAGYTVIMAKRAIIVGNVERLAKLIAPERVQITVNANTTTIDGKTINVRELITFEVETFSFEKLPFMETLCNLSIGDRVTVTFIENDKNWEVFDIVHEPHLGRSPDDWFRDALEDMKFWDNRTK